MNIKNTLLGLCSFLAFGAVAIAQNVFVSIEIDRSQTGATDFQYVQTFFGAEVSDFDVDGATISATSGTLNTSPQVIPPDGSDFDFRDYDADQATIFTNYPNDADYSITTTGNVAGVVTISGPGQLYSNLIPTGPAFTITGVTGGWSGNTFTFNPTGVTSFTISANAYSDTVSGGHFGYGFSVNDGNGVESDIGGGPLTPGTLYTTPIFTFTNGQPADGDDADDTTFGFVDGSSFDLEGNFSNVFNFGPSDLGSGNEGFIIGINTTFNIVADTNFSAVPEPGTFGIFAGLGGLALALTRRRRTSGSSHA